MGFVFCFYFLVPTVVMGSFFPPASSTFVVVCVLDDSHSNWSKVKCHCHFDLHFLYSQGI
jgi:hypothetical protein